MAGLCAGVHIVCLCSHLLFGVDFSSRPESGRFIISLLECWVYTGWGWPSGGIHVRGLWRVGAHRVGPLLGLIWLTGTFGL